MLYNLSVSIPSTSIDLLAFIVYYLYICHYIIVKPLDLVDKVWLTMSFFLEYGRFKWECLKPLTKIDFNIATLGQLYGILKNPPFRKQIMTRKSITPFMSFCLSQISILVVTSSNTF